MTPKQFQRFLDRDADGGFDNGAVTDDLIPQHRIGRGAGGKNFPSNIISFTSLHNGLIESSADYAFYALTRGWHLKSWMEPAKVPCFHVRRGWLMLDDSFGTDPAPAALVDEWLASNVKEGWLH